MTTATELKARILSRADEDGDFRARLVADPKATDDKDERRRESDDQ